MGLLQLAKAPIWIIELFTTAKSFTANPIIGNRFLNKLGLHIARVRAAHAMTRWRTLFLGGSLPAEIKQQYREQGFVKIENFLSAEDFQKVREEILAFQGELRKMIQGDTETFQGLLDDATLEKMPATRTLLKSKRFQDVMCYGGGAYKLPMCFAHCVSNGVAEGTGDPQKDFHSDTFHPTMKAWLFLDHVDDSIGPFNYVPGSHRADKTRLDWDYENSVAGKELENRYAKRGSLRISPDELEARGFAEPVAMKVPANTLVMADTYGFHRRGDAQPGTSRLAIYAYSRANPFNPLPWIAPTSWRRRIEEFVTRHNLRAADRAAAKRGVPPSWRPVPASDLRDVAQPAPQKKTTGATSRDAA